MRLNEKDQQIEKCKESILIQAQKYLVNPPYEKYQQIENVKNRF